MSDNYGVRLLFSFVAESLEVSVHNYFYQRHLVLEEVPT